MMIFGIAERTFSCSEEASVLEPDHEQGPRRNYKQLQNVGAPLLQDIKPGRGEELKVVLKSLGVCQANEM